MKEINIGNKWNELSGSDFVDGDTCTTSCITSIHKLKVITNDGDKIEGYFMVKIKVLYFDMCILIHFAGPAK